MKRKLLHFVIVLLVSSMSSNYLLAQTAQLYRQASDDTAAATEFTYTTSSGGDKITYPGSLSTSSSNICAPAVRRVQMATFVLNYKTSSIGKIVISANSSGSSSTRTLTLLKVNGTDVTSSVTINSTVNGNSGGGASFSDCGEITITGLNVTKDATNGVNLEFTFDNNIRLNTINVWSVESLPLDFISFTAKPDALGKTVALNWITTNEINTKNFEIQKRTDNSQFITIGKLTSANTPGVHHYSFTDNKASGGNSYYQILQFDNDGSSKASTIVPVNIKSATTLSVYPNPVENTLNVNHAFAANNAIIKVMSLDGKTILQKNVEVNSTSTNIDASQLSSGSYLIILENNTEKSSLKFIKK